MSDNIIAIRTALQAGTSISPEWASPKPLPSKLLPVPKMESWMLPAELRAWLEDIAERMDVPLDFVAAPALVSLSSVVGSKLGVAPEAHTSWVEAPNLWGIVVGDPGSKKSPAVREVFGPLRVIEKEELAAHQIEMEYHEAELGVSKLAKDIQERAVKKAIASGDRELAVSLFTDVSQPQPPRKKQRIVTDVTVEKLGEICRDNPEGILFHRDELLTLFDQLDRPEQAANRGFMMEGWNGQASYTFDRIQRGETRIDTVNISLFGTTQPGRISSFIAGNVNSYNDGLVQRLQILVWPDATEAWELVDRAPDDVAAKRAASCYRRLHELRAETVKAAVRGDGSTIPYLRMSADARDLYNDYRAKLEKVIRDGSEAAALRNHLSKFRGLIPSIALLFHLADVGDGFVSAEAMKQALGWAVYLEAHARRAYGSMSIDHAGVARSIVRRIEKGDLQDGFTERDIYAKDWSNLKKGKRLSEALEMLVENGWLRAVTPKANGRPKTTYLINPSVLISTKMAA